VRLVCFVITGRRELRRRDLFISLCGAAVALPFETRAQSKSEPVIGVLSAINVAWLEFPKGLRQTGFVIGANVLLDYHPGVGRQLRIDTRFSRTCGRKTLLDGNRFHRSPGRRRDALFRREITDAALGPNLTVPACFARRICANLHSGYVGERRAPS